MGLTLYQFNSFNKFEKGKAITKYGVHISDRFEGNTGFSLYQLDNFYVEVKYDSALNKISGFTSFSNPSELDPYLDKIDISKIFENRIL